MDPKNAILDNPVDQLRKSADSFNFQLNSGPLMVVPQPGLLYSGGNLSETINPASMWDPLGNLMDMFEAFTQQPQIPGDDNENLAYAIDLSSATATNDFGTTGRGTQASGKSSIPSMLPLKSGRVSKRTRRPSCRSQHSERDSESEGRAKRSKYLKRNYIAALKCREKKKAWMSDLKWTKTQLESVNTNLKRNYDDLRDEISQLKTAALMHAPCDRPDINLWLETEAKTFVQRTASRPDAILPCLSGSASKRRCHG